MKSSTESCTLGSWASIAFLLLSSLFRAELNAQLLAPTAPAEYRSDRLLVMPKAGPLDALAAFHAQHGGEVLGRFAALGGLLVVEVAPGTDIVKLIQAYRESGLVKYAEPDYFRYLDFAPNDPKYLDGTTWGLNNTGGGGGTAGADVGAAEAWDIQRYASNVVVAILDTGIRYTHEDLAANIWNNPLDGSHGFNSINGTTNVLDDSGLGHGTLVAGIVGAVGNNGKGLAGVAWRVQLMAAKCFDSVGNSSDSYILGAMEFARTNGAHVMIASFDSPGYSESLSNAIFAARQAGIVFVASVGNSKTNIDAAPRYPACYDIDNIVSVAYTDRSDSLGVLSNYGATNVDLAAPGEQIYSTWVPTDSYYYGFYSGTSLAAPFVAGTFALLKERFPADPHQQLISRVLSGVDVKPGLVGKCVTGGRLNVRNALSHPITLSFDSFVNFPGVTLAQWTVSAGPTRNFTVEASTNLNSWAPVYSGITSAAGTAGFVDPVSPGLDKRFYRVMAEP